MRQQGVITGACRRDIIMWCIVGTVPTTLLFSHFEPCCPSPSSSSSATVAAVAFYYQSSDYSLGCSLPFCIHGQKTMSSSRCRHHSLHYHQFQPRAACSSSIYYIDTDRNIARKQRIQERERVKSEQQAVKKR